MLKTFCNKNYYNLKYLGEVNSWDNNGLFGNIWIVYYYMKINFIYSNKF